MNSLGAIRDHFTQRFSIYMLLTVLSLLMLTYYFVYIPNNERQLNDHAVRILDSKAISISEKFQGYQLAIGSSPISYFSKWYFTIQPDVNKLFFYYYNGKYYYSDDSSSLQRFKDEVPGPIDSLTRDDFTRYARVDPKFLPETHGPESDEDRDKDVWKTRSGNYFFIYTPNPDFVKVDRYVNQEKTFPYLWVHVNGFMANLEQNDFFNDLFLVRDTANKAKYESKDEEASGLDNQILDGSNLGLVRFDLPDSARRTGTGVYVENVSGKNYRVYYKLVKLKRNLNVYIIGLVDVSHFQREARRIPPWFLVLCLLLALILILTLPLLKFFFLNKHESLTTVDAKLSVFSVIMFASLVVILLVGSYLFWGIENKQAQSELIRLSNRIRDSTKTSIKLLDSALLTPELFKNDKMEENATEFKSKFPQVRFNEVFSLDQNGYMKKIFRNDVNTLNLDLFPINVSGRSYFRTANAAIGDSEFDYAIESINSFASGKSEAAVSIPFKEPEDWTIRVITSKLPSLINPLIPTPYKYVVMNKSGDIMFHSDWVELKSENFINESENDYRIQAYLENNMKGKISFSYLRRDCSGYIQPLIKDWYLLVYHEMGNIRSLAAQVFSLCLVTLALIVIFCALLHIIINTDRVKPLLLHIRSFTYDWLNPAHYSGSFWLSLFMINVMLLLVEIIWYFYVHLYAGSTVASICLVFSLIATSYMINYVRLNRKLEPGKKLSSIKWLIVIFCVSLLGFIVVTVINKDFPAFIILGLSVPLSLLTWYTPTIISGIKSKINRINLDNYKAYQMFLFSWLAVVATGPVIIFMTEHYKFQSRLRDYSYLVEDFKKYNTIHSVTNGDVGMDYTTPLTNSIKFDSVRNNSPDFLFYGFIPRYITQEEARGGLLQNELPEYHDFKLYSAGNTLKIEAPRPTRKDDKEYYARYATMDKATINLDKPFLYTLTIAILCLVAFFWLLKVIPKKIFLVHGGLILVKFPKRNHTLSVFEQEFENNDVTNHLLNDFDAEDKNKLITEYNQQYERAGNKMEKQLACEKFILQLQKKAHNEYQHAWDTCSQSEKFFLYDLAKDGIANQTNENMIQVLSEKGLIRVDPRLEIVNQSFANFVCDEMDDTELSALEQKASSQGSWHNLRIMLIIIIVAAFGFLSIAEEGFMGRATTLIASIAMVIPNLINVFGAITKIFARS